VNNPVVTLCNMHRVSFPCNVLSQRFKTCISWIFLFWSCTICMCSVFSI